MDDNHPNKPDAGTDPEWENVQKMTPGLAEEAGAREAEAAEAKAKADAEAAQVASEKEAATKAEAEAAAKAEADAKVAAEGQEKKPTRPEKYIPIKQYTEEKGKWKETIAEKEKRIAELEVLATKANTAQTDEKVQKYADKHGISFEEAKEQVEDLRNVLGVERKEPTPAKPAATELTPEQKQELEEAALIRAEKAFVDEFNSVAVPQLKQFFPNATPEQLAKAQKELERLACTQPFLDKSLDFVVFKSQKELAEVFKAPPASPEAQRSAPQKGVSEFTAADFKDGKTSFDELFALSSEKQAKIVEDMDVSTYERYTRYINSQDTLEINRGGQKIKF